LMVEFVVPDERLTQEEPEGGREEREGNDEEPGDHRLVLPLHESPGERDDHERRRDKAGAHQECERAADQLRAALEPWNIPLEVRAGPIGILDGGQVRRRVTMLVILPTTNELNAATAASKKAGAIASAITCEISRRESSVTIEASPSPCRA
jgi:hypothetical protein